MVTFGGTVANLCSLFHGQKFLKLLKRLTVGQAVPEIPLSVGSKLELYSELLSLPNFRILPRTLTLLSAYAYCRVYYKLYTCTLQRCQGFCTLVPSSVVVFCFLICVLCIYMYVYMYMYDCTFYEYCVSIYMYMYMYTYIHCIV